MLFGKFLIKLPTYVYNEVDIIVRCTTNTIIISNISHYNLTEKSFKKTK